MSGPDSHFTDTRKEDEWMSDLLKVTRPVSSRAVLNVQVEMVLSLRIWLDHRKVTDMA